MTPAQRDRADAIYLRLVREAEVRYDRIPDAMWDAMRREADALAKAGIETKAERPRTER